MTQSGGAATSPLLIAIDGLGGVGKSTVGRIVASRLGCRFVDAGELYRALTWLAIQRGIDTRDELKVTTLASEASVEVKSSPDSEWRAVTVDRCDVTDEIYTRKVEAEVSNVSGVPGVRSSVVSYQRRMASEGRLVMAGRDIGTVVLPHAHLKVFLVASVEERAKRRHRDQRGIAEASYEDTLADMKRRDAIDRSRDLSPTVPAQDARIVDTEGLTPSEVADRILAMAKEAS